MSTTQKSSWSARNPPSRTSFCADVEVFGYEGDAAGLMGVWVRCGVGEIRIEYAGTWCWGVMGGGATGGVGYDLEPNVEATSTGSRPVLVNPSQAE